MSHTLTAPMSFPSATANTIFQLFAKISFLVLSFRLCHHLFESQMFCHIKHTQLALTFKVFCSLLSPDLLAEIQSQSASSCL